MKIHNPPACTEDEEELLKILEKDPFMLTMSMQIDPDDFYREANRERFQKILETNRSEKARRLCARIRAAANKRRRIGEIIETLKLSSRGE